MLDLWTAAFVEKDFGDWKEVFLVEEDTNAYPDTAGDAMSAMRAEYFIFGVMCVYIGRVLFQ